MKAAELLSMKTKVKQNVTEEGLRLWMANYLAEEMKIDPSEIAVDVELSQYDFDSVLAMSITAELEDILGRKLSPTLAYNYPTIEQLTAHLVQG
jgi:acyl carrier protein